MSACVTKEAKGNVLKFKYELYLNLRENDVFLEGNYFFQKCIQCIFSPNSLGQTLRKEKYVQ